MPNKPLRRSNSLHEAEVQKAVDSLTTVDCTDVFRRKIKTLFKLFDPNDEGVMSKETFKVFVERQTAVQKCSPEDTKRYMENVMGWFGDIFKDEPSITFDRFLKSYIVIASSPELMEGMREHSMPATKKAFDMVDLNHDGIISKHEWRMYFKGLGINDESIADYAFNAIDLNKDGVLSVEEFQEGMFDFFTNPESGRYDSFFGPLADA